MKILQALEKGRAAGDIETLEQLCRFLGPGKTFCAHAPGAVEPLQSAIKYFRDEFEAGISQKICVTSCRLQVSNPTCLSSVGI